MKYLKSRNFYIIIVIFVMLLAGILVIYKYNNNNNFLVNNNSNNNNQDIDNTDIKLPEIDFDTEAQILNTNIKFKYPSKGFYNLGIKIINKTPDENLIAGVHIEPTLEFDRNAQSAYVITEIKLVKNKENFRNIEDFAFFFKTDSTATSFEKEYAKENGHFVVFNNRKYFIFKMTEDATAWTALAIWENSIIAVSLAYTNSFTPYSEAIYKNNDKLFLEILNNISFK